jgi:O-antigen ligase
LSSDILTIARLAFWTLAVLVVLLPLRYSVIAYILLVQFDLSGSAFYSTDTLGIENAIKVVAIPSLLWIRARRESTEDAGEPGLRWIWLLLVAYAAISIVWSPFKLAALKMLGYFYAYIVLFDVFRKAWRKEWLNSRSLILVMWCSLLFAVVQSYVLGNPYGVMGNYYGAPDFEFRFTSFTGAQSFAAFLLSLFAILLFTQRWSAAVIVTALAAAAGILLTGSRSIFIGFLWIIVFLAVVYAKRKGRRFTLAQVAKRIALGMAVLLVAGIVVLKNLPENRLNQLFSAMVSPDSSMEDVGTFVWRFSLYQKTLEALSARSPQRLLVGSGTSSAAALVLDTGVFTLANVDANRAIHDEFLRALYEWGVPGVLLLIAFLVEASRICIRKIRECNADVGWLFIAILVPMLISLAVENFLAESASPGGVGYMLVLTAMLAGGAPEQKAPGPAETNWFWVTVPRGTLSAN